MPALELTSDVPKGGVPVAVCYSHTDAQDGDYVVLHSDTLRGSGSPAVRVSPTSHLVIEPNHEAKARDIVFCAAASGAGKSWLARAFALRYHELWPDRPVVLVSGLPEDETLDAASFIRRIRLDTLLEAPLQLEELRQSLLIVDDALEGTLSKELEEAIWKLINLVCSQGRHEMISCWINAHLVSNGAKTRLLLSESHYYVTFAHGTSASAYRWLLGHYGGCDSSQIAAMRKLPSRWTALRRHYPPLVVYDGGAYLLHAT